MGVYLPNMDMPKNCVSCGGRHGAECWLADCSYIPNYHKERPKWCPLFPVPPHGRLIDADALDADLERQDMHTGEWDAVGFSIEEIENAPTIIPAEEGE